MTMYEAEMLATQGKKVAYRYGMRLRGFSIGCQPSDGLIRREDDPTGKYWDIVVYNRALTEAEVKHYSLDALD